jgi:Linalool dehydratase/isomerase
MVCDSNPKHWASAYYVLFVRTMAFMPWNYDKIQSMYPSTGNGYLQKIDGRINLLSPAVTTALREIIAKEGGDYNDPDIIERARKMTAGAPPSKKPYMSPTFGYISQWLSEVAGPEDLDLLLSHADKFMSPSWSNGGLYYARCNEDWDKDGNYKHVDPYTGNGGIGYARLNVKDGQKKMWDMPWTKEEVEERPWIDEVSLEQDVDCLRGTWIAEENAMVATFRTWNGNSVAIKPVVKMLPIGTYGVYVNGELKFMGTVAGPSDGITVDLEVGSEEVDLVLLGGHDRARL